MLVILPLLFTDCRHTDDTMLIVDKTKTMQKLIIIRLNETAESREWKVLKMHISREGISGFERR